MKQRRETNAKSHTTWIPQIIAASLINPCQTVQWSVEFFLPHYSPISELQISQTISDCLQMIYNYNKYTERWEHRYTEKGVVLTAEGQKYNHRKKYNNLPLKIRDSIAFDHFGDFIIMLYERK